MFVCTVIFLQINLFDEIITELLIYYVNMKNMIVVYATVWYSKKCITHKRSPRTDWKFENNLLLSVSTELCHNNSILGLQNEDLSHGVFATSLGSKSEVIWSSIHTLLHTVFDLSLFPFISTIFFLEMRWQKLKLLFS